MIQIFINLIKNSIEAFSDESDSDNEIILSTNNEHGFIIKEKLSEERLKLPIKISVMDNGPGIPEELKDTIFFQKHSYIKNIIQAAQFIRPWLMRYQTSPSSLKNLILKF